MRDPVQRNVPPRPGGGGGDAAGSGRPAEQSGATGTMSIGEVLGILKPEFPDITVSKIRFLEGAGLVQPDRSASGYRKFSEDDVARLRFVLRAQRDQYLPLRVIRQRLADLEKVGGLEAKGSGAGALGIRVGRAPAGLGPWSAPGAGAPGTGGSGAGATGTGSSGTGAARGWCLRAPGRRSLGGLDVGPGHLEPARPELVGPELVRPGHRSAGSPGISGGLGRLVRRPLWGSRHAGPAGGSRPRRRPTRSSPATSSAAPPAPTWSSSWSWSRSAW